MVARFNFLEMEEKVNASVLLSRVGGDGWEFTASSPVGGWQQHMSVTKLDTP